MQLSMAYCIACSTAYCRSRLARKPSLEMRPKPSRSRR